MLETRLLIRVSRTLTMMSYTCPSSTCSSMSARARTWSGECGRTACIHGMQKMESGTLRQPTTIMSQWYEVPWQKCLISYLIKSINKNSFSNEKIFSILRSERGQLSKLIKHDSITKLIFVVNFVQMHFFLDQIWSWNIFYLDQLIIRTIDHGFRNILVHEEEKRQREAEQHPGNNDI